MKIEETPLVAQERIQKLCRVVLGGGGKATTRVKRLFMPALNRTYEGPPLHPSESALLLQRARKHWYLTCN